MNPVVVLELLDLDTPAIPLPIDALDAAEQARAARFFYAEDRRRFTHGRAWLRLRLGEAMGIAPAEVRFTTVGSRGKPAVASKLAPTTTAAAVASKLAPTLPAFNLSHSDRHGLLALCAAGISVGVDIEVARPFERATRIAARHFSEWEAASIEACAPGMEREQAFFRTWTRKEAYLKLTGLGLPGGLACVETGTGSDARTVLVPPEHGLSVAWITSLEGPPPLARRADGRAAGGFGAPNTPPLALAALAAPHPVALRWRE